MGYRLFEVVKKSDKETQRIYPTDLKTSSESLTEVAAQFEKGLGNAMKATDEQAHSFLILDNTGEIAHDDNGNSYIAFVGDGTLEPRLWEVKEYFDEDTQAWVNEAIPHHYETDKLVEANYHIFLGNAMLNTNVKAEMLRSIDEKGMTAGKYCYWVRIDEKPPVTEPTPVEPTEG